MLGHGNLIQGNFIGPDITGSAALGTVTNASWAAPGIHILGAHGNTIGGDTSGSGNLISGNDGEGILANHNAPASPLPHDNIVQGNRIGTKADGVTPMGNGSHGVSLFDTDHNTVGGLTPGAGNAVAHNGGDGIRIESGTGNTILGNSILGNMGLGINLGVDGVTPNDAGDADLGPNGTQNFPVISSAVVDGATLSVAGALHTSADSMFTIQLFASSNCDSSGYGEGGSYLGSKMVTTDVAGDGAFSVALSGSVAGVLTATAPLTLLATPPNSRSAQQYAVSRISIATE